MTTLHLLKSAIFTVAILTGSLSAGCQSVDVIIDKHIVATGGISAWQKVNTISMQGEYDYGGIVFPFASVQSRPDHYRYKVTHNDKFFAQGFDGTSGWMIDQFKNETTPKILTGKAASLMANENDVELESALLNYKSKGHQLSLEGTDSVGSRPCFKIKVVKKNGDTEWYFIDKNTYELAMKQSTAKNVELNGAMVNIFYSDYRKVQGVRLPFSTVVEMEGQKILLVTVKNVLVNEPIDEKVFQP